MFEEERQIQILNQLNKKSSMSVRQLSDILHVSPSTIRRDLTYMEKKGLIKRTHGGAMIMQSLSESLNYNSKKSSHYELKLKIAELAAQQIKDGDIVSLNSSTITSLMPQFITARNITIITNSLNIAQSLKNKEACELILLGGIYLNQAETIEGPMTVNQILTMKYNKSFIGANGIDIDFGFSSASELESASKMATIKQSTQTFFVCEHAKFDRSSLHKICSLNDANFLITDCHANPDTIEKYSKFISILIAK